MGGGVGRESFLLNIMDFCDQVRFESIEIPGVLGREMGQAKEIVASGWNEFDMLVMIWLMCQKILH